MDFYIIHGEHITVNKLLLSKLLHTIEKLNAFYPSKSSVQKKSLTNPFLFSAVLLHLKENTKPHVKTAHATDG